ETQHMLLSAYHWKRLVNGYSGYLPPTYFFLAGIAQRLPDRDALQDLVDLVDLRWLIVHRFSRQPVSAWEGLEQAGAVGRWVTGDDEVLYEVRLPQRRNLVDQVRGAVLHIPETSLLGTPLTPLSDAALRAEWVVPPLPERVRPAQLMRFDLT